MDLDLQFGWERFYLAFAVYRLPEALGQRTVKEVAKVGIRSPCFGCVEPKRYIGCHGKDKCLEYMDYLAEEEKRKQFDKDKAFDPRSNFISQTIKKNLKWQKGGLK